MMNKEHLTWFFFIGPDAPVSWLAFDLQLNFWLKGLGWKKSSFCDNLYWRIRGWYWAPPLRSWRGPRANQMDQFLGWRSIQFPWKLVIFFGKELVNQYNISWVMIGVIWKIMFGKIYYLFCQIVNFKFQNTSFIGSEIKMDDSILLPVKSSYIFW